MASLTELTSQRKIIQDTQYKVVRFLANDSLGRLTQNSGINSKLLFSRTLEEIKEFPDDSDAKQYIFATAKLLGPDVSTWIRKSLLIEPVVTVWKTHKLRSYNAYNTGDPKWLKDIALTEWAKENWFEKLKTESYNPTNIDWLGHFIIFLRVYGIGLSLEIDSLNQQIRVAEAEAKQAKADATNSENANETKKATSPTQESLINMRAKEAEEIKKSQRDSTQLAYEIYKNKQTNFQSSLDNINEHLPANRKLEKIHIASLISSTEISSLFSVKSDSDIDKFLTFSGVMSRVGNNPKALSEIRNLFRLTRADILNQRKAEGESTNSLSSSDEKANTNLIRDLHTLTKDYSSKTITNALTKKKSELEENSIDNEIRKEFAKSIVIGQSEKVGIFGRYLSALRGNTGKQASETTDAQTDQIALENMSIVEFAGSPNEDDELADDSYFEYSNSNSNETGLAEEYAGETDESDGSSKTSGPRLRRKKRKPTSPAELQKKAKRLQQVAKTSNTLAKNPLAAGIAGTGAGALGVGLYGLVTQGIAAGAGAGTIGLVGGAAGAWAGAQIGAAIGSILGPVGTVIGGIGGAFIGGLGGSVAAGGASLAIGDGVIAKTVGNAELNLATGGSWGNGIAPGGGVASGGANAANIAAQTVAKGASTVASTLPPTSAIAGGATNSLGAFANGLHALARLPTFFGGALNSTMLVAAPPAAAGLLTIAIVLPGLLSPYLTPLNGNGGTGAGGINGVGGCWPATGLLEQGPFDQGKVGTHNYVSGVNRILLDAVDIGGKMGEPIFAPFAGNVSFYNQDTGTYAGGKYGNYALLRTDAGKELLFAHFSNFFLNLIPGGSYPVTAGQQIGYMGDSETQLTDTSGAPIPGSNVHLHYEAKPTISQLSALPLPATSVMDSIVPEPIIYASQWVVPVTQQVSSSVCGGGSNASGSGTIAPHSGPIKGTVGCFKFEEGSQTWGHTVPDELATYMAEMTKEISDPRVDKAICGHGDVRIVRTKSDAPDGGCLLSSGNSVGAITNGDRSILVCDKVFSDPTGFGTSTMWHEPGHIVQLNNVVGSNTWKYYFKDRSPSGYLPTYPYKQSEDTEDFAESFGMCNRTRITGQSGYRHDSNMSYTLSPYSTNQCADIESLLNAI